MCAKPPSNSFTGQNWLLFQGNFIKMSLFPLIYLGQIRKFCSHIHTTYMSIILGPECNVTLWVLLLACDCKIRCLHTFGWLLQWEEFICRRRNWFHLAAFTFFYYPKQCCHLMTKLLTKVALLDRNRWRHCLG